MCVILALARHYKLHTSLWFLGHLRLGVCVELVAPCDVRAEEKMKVGEGRVHGVCMKLIPNRMDKAVRHTVCEL